VRELLLAERDQLLPLLRHTHLLDFDRLTVCDLWSVRDIVAHCSAVMIRAAKGSSTGYTPADNQHDVDERKAWTIAELLAELESGFDLAAQQDAPQQVPHGVALGVWVHGGDIREALSVHGAYTHAGLAPALALLVERSIARGVPAVDVTLTDAVDHGLDGAQVSLGDPRVEPVGWLRTDTAGLFRLVAGRRTELVERDLVGVRVGQLLMF
jgi:uncharacterized protein (TIGR03083 family)